MSKTIKALLILSFITGTCWAYLLGDYVGTSAISNAFRQGTITATPKTSILNTFRRGTITTTPKTTTPKTTTPKTTTPKTTTPKTTTPKTTTPKTTTPKASILDAFRLRQGTIAPEATTPGTVQKRIADADWEDIPPVSAEEQKRIDQKLVEYHQIHSAYDPTGEIREEVIKQLRRIYPEPIIIPEWIIVRHMITAKKFGYPKCSDPDWNPFLTSEEVDSTIDPAIDPATDSVYSEETSATATSVDTATSATGDEGIRKNVMEYYRRTLFPEPAIIPESYIERKIESIKKFGYPMCWTSANPFYTEDTAIVKANDPTTAPATETAYIEETSTPTETATTPISGSADINGDTKVNLADFAVLLSYWEKDVSDVPAGQGSDINGDGKIDIVDVAIIMAQWTG